jgi:hypothetical protein
MDGRETDDLKFNGKSSFKASTSTPLNIVINSPNSTFHQQILINSHTTPKKSQELSHELGIIKSNFSKEIAALKSFAAVSGDNPKHHSHHHNLTNSFASSSSFTSSNPNRKASIESIKPSTKWNEKMAAIPFDDKFSTIIDDGVNSKGGDEEDEDKERSRLMMKQEIDEASRRDYSFSENESNRSESRRM